MNLRELSEKTQARWIWISARDWSNPLRLFALFFCVAGSRLWLVAHYSLPSPYWDQWYAEGMWLLKPWLEGHLDFHTLFVPHNEHRIVLTRLVTLGLFTLNQQWDNQVEMAANAIFCGLSAVGIAGALLAAFQDRFERAILLAVALYFCLPFAWENTLCGFQSQNYFLNFFSLLALWGLGLKKPASAGWWAGLAGAALAWLSMASGFLAPAVVLVVLAFRLRRDHRAPSRGECLTAAFCAVLVIAGWLTRTVVPGHALLKAESLPAFLRAFGSFLAWPFCENPGLGLLALLPPVFLTWLSLRHPTKQAALRTPADFARADLLLAASGWAILQTAAIAYGRGGHGALPSSRYQDIFALVPLTNFLIGLTLWTWAEGPLRRTLVLILLGAVTIGFLIRLQTETRQILRDLLPGYVAGLRAGEAEMRGYVATGDLARFSTDESLRYLPYPDARPLADALDDPTLRRILPADLRAPLALRSDGGTAFVADGQPPGQTPPAVFRIWGSYTTLGAAQTGVFQARPIRPATLPYLRFLFDHGPGQPRFHFFLQAATPGSKPGSRPQLPASRPWHGADLRVPAADFRLIAQDNDPNDWFAFSEPVEVGVLSHWTGYLLRRASWLFFAGVALAIGLELLACLARGFLCSGYPRPPATPGPDLPTAVPPLQLLSIVIPARNEEGCLVATVESLHATLQTADVPHEILAVNDGSTDGTADVLGSLSEQIAQVRPLTNPGRHGFGRAVVYGLDQAHGDAVVILMADGSDSPADVVLYWRTLQTGCDCVFGSRFVRGSRVVDYPWFKLAMNRLANLFIRWLFQVRCNDVTNAFKAYRREVIDGCRPLVAPHFNLTVELPLKAMVRGYRWQMVPIQWRNRKAGATKFRLKEMGSRYLFICLSIWLEKHLSRDDYRRG